MGIDFSDLDPTSDQFMGGHLEPEDLLLGPGGAITKRLMGGGGGSPEMYNDPAVKAAVDRFYSLGQGYAADLKKGGYDPAKRDEYFEQSSAPIEADYFDQAQKTSTYLARQGLGNSGVNISAHSGLAGNKAALDRQAFLQSTRMAEETRRRELLDSFAAEAQSLGPMLQKYGIDVNQYMEMLRLRQAQEEANADRQSAMFRGLGTFGGLMLGGPAGAAVGGGIGDSIGGADAPWYMGGGTFGR